MLAVGLYGSPLFLTSPHWSPPDSWVRWVLAAVAGAPLLSVRAALDGPLRRAAPAKIGRARESTATQLVRR